MPNNDYILRSDALNALSRGSGCENICSNAIKRIPAADVEPKRKWIPVTERLPKKNDEVIVICYDDYPECCTIWYSLTGEMQWWGAEQWYQTKHIKYWMPLPEPPKEESHENRT